MSVRVVSASQAAELDANAMASGVPSRALMQAAGRSAAALLLERFPLESARGVAVFAGPGNNGGDAWVMAGELARRGVRVRVAEIAEPKTPDAIAAREAARAHLDRVPPIHTEGVIVDGLLGTGATGAPRGAIAEAIERIAIQRASDATAARGVPLAGALVRIVALDVPSGVDATTGATPGLFVRADLTVTFGSLKRGLLVNREAAGTIVVADIGLGAESGRFAQAPPLVDAAMVRAHVPPIAADAHKGVRKRLAIVGGALGMAGAPVLAARAALRSGIGMVKLCVARESMGAVQSAEPTAMAVAWPETERERDELLGWAHALLIGPGIGATPRARALVGDLLSVWTGPVVLDADALTLFEGEPAALGALLGAARRTRASPAVITPHVVEFARLAGLTAAEVEARRFDIVGELARTIDATVLLKGVPTIISDGATTLVSAAGTPVLATAGSGDVLGGIVATLVAQTGDALESAAAAAWVHGRAAEIAAAGQVRGVTLSDVLDSLRATWRLDDAAPQPPVLAEFAAVGDRPA
jgi:hydroxyethylthiazole kinase-like uncharacterized protein yjeF